MNILYILGNGFDKAQGMHTSYPEFYKYLKRKTENDSELMELLKKDIDDKKTLWSDMEVALGQFTSQIQSASDFDDLYFKISKHLQTYLKEEEHNYNPSDQLKEKFIHDFINPFSYIESTDKNNLNRLRTTKNPIGHPEFANINVMSLNYTNTLERLLSIDIAKSSDEFTYDHNFDHYHSLKKIIHVHGQLDDSIIIGVDNENQIANEQFKKNMDIKDLLVKEQSNHVMGNTRHIQCEWLIKEADVIFLFGVSLGETDAHWWNLIGDMFLNNNLYIIQHIFKRNYTGIHPTQKQLYGRLNRKNRYELMKAIGFSDDEKKWPKDTEDRLFFITNSNIFKL